MTCGTPPKGIPINKNKVGPSASPHYNSGLLEACCHFVLHLVHHTHSPPILGIVNSCILSTSQTV